MSDTTRATLVITGKVQGVFFRASAQEKALALGLTGWVRNRSDGSVEALAEGPRERVEAFIAWCWQGPEASRVESVQTRFLTASGEFSSFTIER